MVTKTSPEPGTVIHATLRSEDLIPAFLDTLRFHDRKAAARVNASYQPERRRVGFYETELAMFMVEDLFNALNDIAPAGHYFGAHPGDGSDFGFWECEPDPYGD